MTNEEMIEQLEQAIGLIKQDGKDWLDDRDIPIIEACIKSLTALDKIRAEVEYTEEQYQSDMQKLLAEKGLHDAVEIYCDKINEVAGVLTYVSHRDIQEFLCDILYLIDLEKEQKDES